MPTQAADPGVAKAARERRQARLQKQLEASPDALAAGSFFAPRVPAHRVERWVRGALGRPV